MSKFSVIALFLLSYLLMANNAFAAHSTASMTFYTLSDTENFVGQVNDLPQAQWTLQDASSFLLSPSGVDNWLRINIKNTLDYQQVYFLQLSNNELPSAQAYIEQADGYTPLYGKLGLEHQFNRRPILYRHVTYPLIIDANSEINLVFQLKHLFPLKIYPAIYLESEFQQHTTKETLFFGMLYGILSMIIIYSLFIYFTLRERGYLLFLLFGIFTGIFLSMQEGHFYQFIEPNKVWAKEGFYGLITALMCLSFTLFTLTFLDLQRRSKLAVRIMMTVGIVISLFLLLLGLNQQPIILSHFTFILIAVIYATAITIASIIWKVQRSSSAGFFALAISLCNIGFLLDLLVQLGILPWSIFDYGFASLGSTAMTVVFAFALAYKMRVLQQREVAASKELLALNEEKNKNYLLHYQEALRKAELEKSANEAYIQNRTKSEFIATMSSDIRTPMNSILGLSELLKDTELDKKQAYLIDSINHSAKYLLNIINDLIDYSQIQTGQVTMDMRVFNLEKLIDECISIFSMQSTEAKVFFTGLVVPGTPLQYRTDPEKLRQIILNMLSNAFHFEQLKGVSLRAESTGKNTVNNNELRFSVICHGVVLNEQDIHSLLSPYDSQQEKTCGHDLGLTLGLELAELMQGKLGIDVDEEEQLSTIWFTARLFIPNKDEALTLPDYSRLLNGRRLLICDSRPHFTQAVSLLTQSWGMEVTIVRDGQEAINTLLQEEQNYRILMISDELFSPDIHFAVRKNNVHKNISTSIILTTRTRFAYSKEEGQRMGIQFVLEKPWTTQQLFKSLQTSIGLEESKIEDANSKQALKVLIAEDNNINLMVLDGLLKKRQLAITTAKDGKEALERYHEEEGHFDIIFMDCEMPNLDGYQATMAIREAEKQNHLESVIIGLSAYTDSEYREKAIQAGMDDFIAKPISLEQIDTLLENYRAGFFHHKTEVIIEDDEPKNTKPL